MTDPLTPADCDLRDFAFMPLDTIRLLDSDLYALATGEEFRAALTLWCKAWQQVPAASLPNDDRVLAHLSGCGARWKKVRGMALRGFILCSDGRLYHPVVAEKALASWAKRQSYRERSKKGNGKRWASHKDGQEQSNSDPSAIPKGVLEPPKGQGQGQGEDSVANATAAAAPFDPEKIMFDSGVRLLAASGKSDGAARSLIGKWRKDHGTPAVIEALGACHRGGYSDPVGWIEKRFQGRSLANDHALATPC